MKNSQKGFAVALLLGIIALLIIGGGVYYFYSRSNRPTDYVNEALKQTYKALVNKADWNSKLIKSDNPESWNILSKNTEIKIIDTQNNFYCSDKKANFIKYSTHINPNFIGDWNTVSVVDCGTYYFIYEYGDSGPKLYGPFELNMNISVLNQNNISTTTIMQGVSMQPTYKSGTILKISRNVSDVKRNHVILYNHVSNPNANFIKRVVGLPNETISISNGEIYVNGIEINIPNIPIVKGPDFIQIRLSNNEYFVLGDNTEQSFDSRAGGPVLKKDIAGIIIGSI